MNEPKFDLNVTLSLFDGISCGQEALKKAGISTRIFLASEIEKYPKQITRKNHPLTVQLGDVTKVVADDLPHINLLMGGSPCQGFSFAGKQLNFDDPRSALFFEFVRLLRECKPDFFLLENVMMKQEFKDIITEHLGVEPVMINSSLVSAQSRKRLYWTNIPGVVGITQPKDKGIVLKDILETNADNKYNLSESKVDRVLNSERGKGYFYDEDSEKIGTVIAGYHKLPTDGSYVKRPTKPKVLIKEEWNPKQTKNYVQWDIHGKGHKSQDQRAYYEDGKHGALPAAGGQSKVKVMCGRVVGRKINPETGKRDDYNPDLKMEQRLEPRLDEKSGTLTTVTKDNVVVLNENQKRKIDKINTTTDKANCLTEAIGRGGSSSEFLTSVKKKTLVLEAPTYRKLTCVECERLQT